MLEKEGVSLDEILAEDELIQECKAINPKLVDLCESTPPARPPPALARAHVFCATAPLTHSPTPGRSLKAPEIVDLLEAHVAGDLPLRRRDYVPPESARLAPARPNSGDLRVLDRRTHLHYLKNNDGATWERWEDQAHGQLQVDGEMRLSFGYARERRRRGAAGPRLVRRVYHLVTAVDRGRSGRGHGDQYDARELHNLKLVHYLEVPDDAANPHGSSRGKARKRARDDDEYEDLPVAPPGMRLMFADASEANDDVLAWMVDSDDDGDADDAWA